MANDPLNLDESGEWAGLWWLPDNTDEQVPGVLRYDLEGGLSLSLIGAFEDRITSTPARGVTMYHEGTRTWDVIHGVAEQREITLLGCAPKSVKRTMFARVKSPDKQTVASITAIIGAHVSGDDRAISAAPAFSVLDGGQLRAREWLGVGARLGRRLRRDARRGPAKCRSRCTVGQVSTPARSATTNALCL
ncbi:hypothetical protein [Actinophytocola xinjiangensis]|uniref:ApeA N-terminal domain 1-containing protein n=1 Tax=Actinophytocola xinjiangensis TaxID=485602 RepID=UPI000B12725C|nr:hypothetical protein [Actinophytocola xinjiangensis]